MLKVPNGQDPYNVIGQYIQNHITAIEDIIATIEIDGIRTNELFMVDMQEDGYFVWNSDWYEGEQNIALIDFFPVSEAEPERKKGKWIQSEEKEGMEFTFYEIHCSECGVLRKIGWTGANFCPNCGADMRG